MEQLVNLTLSGAVTGGIFALIAAGLTLSYASTGIFNFAYGAIAFTAGFVFYELHVGLGWPALAAAAFVVAVCAPVLGALLNFAVLRPLGRSNDVAKIMGTIGLLIALPALARWLVLRGIEQLHWNIPDGESVQAQAGIWRTPPYSWTAAGVRITSNDVVILGCVAAAAVGLYLLLQHSRTGLQMRAVVDRPDLAALRGVSEGRTSYIAWIVGSSLAALAGVAGAPYFGPLMAQRYADFTLIAAAAVVVARMRSVPVAVAAGIGLGIAKNYVAEYATFARDIQGFENAVPFVVMLAGLLLLRHDRGRRAGTAPRVEVAEDHAADLSAWRRTAPLAIASTALFLGVMFVFDEFWLTTLSFGLALSVVLLSFVVVTGLGGMVSLAQATFVTASGLTAGLLVQRYDLPFLLAAIGGSLVAVALGVVIALPSLRVGGLALALATLALALVGESVLFQWSWIRNGQQGWRLERPELGPLDLADPRTMAVTMMACVAVTVAVVLSVRRSRLGRAVLAVRDSEAAAEAAGISVVRAKLAVFAIAAGIAGAGGALLAVQQGSITNVSFPASLGLLWLATTVLFGIRRPAGAVIAGLVTAGSAVWLRSGWVLPSAFPTWLDWGGAGNDWSDVAAILFGLGAVQLAREPEGVLAVVGSQLRRRRQRYPGPLVQPPVGVTERPAAATTRSLEPCILHVADLEAGYGHIQVLRGITLCVAPHSVHALLGPNGAGKSTLCLALAGATVARTGTIVLNGVDVTQDNAWRRARRGLVLAPESRGVFPQLTVTENLATWLSARADRDAVFDRFPVLGERRNQPAANLSGGEQQILTLAPLLHRPPQLLIMDEPSLGLAPRVVDDVAHLLAALKSAGTAILYADEKPNRLIEEADTVSVLRSGRIAWTGRPDELTGDLLAEVYLGDTNESSPSGASSAAARLP